MKWSEFSSEEKLAIISVALAILICLSVPIVNCLLFSNWRRGGEGEIGDKILFGISALYSLAFIILIYR